MKNVLITCCILMMLGSCSTNDVPVRENMLKNKSFVYLYYPTLQECMDAQPDPDFFINCHQQVDFYSGKRVDILLSDLYYRGSYKIMGDHVVLTFDPGTEITDVEILCQIVNHSKMLDLDTVSVWNKVSGNLIGTCFRLR